MHSESARLLRDTHHNLTLNPIPNPKPETRNRAPVHRGEVLL